MTNISLKEHSSIYLSSIEKEPNSVAIMVKGTREPKCLKQIRVIPGCMFLDELDNGDEWGPSLIVCFYRNPDNYNFILEKFKLDTCTGDIFDIEKKETKDYAYLISKGVYLFKTLGQSPYLCTAWDKRLDLNSFKNMEGLRALDFNFSNELRQVHSNIAGIDLKLGNVETLRTLFKLPTEPYEYFTIFQNVYSFMTDQIYQFGDSEFNHTYNFVNSFNESTLSHVVKLTQLNFNAKSDEVNKRLIKELGKGLK